MEKTKKYQSFPTMLCAALAGCATFACPGSHPAIAAEAAPLAAFGRLPTLEDVAISPDGSKIVFVRTNGESRKLLVPRAGYEQRFPW